jgi:pyruvyl transferase EpsO
LIAAAMLAAPFVAAYGFFINLLDRLKQYLPLQFMLNLAEPVLIAAYVRDRDFSKLSHHNRLLYQCNLLFLMPALACVLAVGAQLTGLLTGGKYQQQGWILAVLLIQLALGSHATILQIIINAVGKSNVLRWSGGAALLALCMTLALVAFGGGENAPLYLVAAPLVYEAVNNLMGVVLLRRQGYAYDVGWVFHGKLLAASFIAYFCAQLAAGEFDVQVLQVLAAGVVAVSSFIASILLLRVLDARDMDVLRTWLRRETKA